ncbi:MAG: hypothetical protein CL721_02745 [Chloroflexi bacterium]|nr:hypothetical protein [Chloroflexota bacterium]
MTTGPRPNYEPIPTGQSSRSMVIECEADDLGNMLRRVNVSGFRIMCDEPKTIGGNGTTPAPLHYFATSILF